MHGTQFVRRAAQTLSSEEASRLVTAAARRASETSRASSKRPRRYLDLVAVGLATVVAGTALKNRRAHEERVSLLEAELARAETDRDRARDVLDRVKTVLVDGASEAVKTFDSAAPGKDNRGMGERTVALQRWVEDGFDRVSKEEADQEMGTNRNANEKPKMI